MSHTFSDWLQGVIWPRCGAHWEAEALKGVAHQRVLIKPDFSSFMSVTREIRPACTIYQTLIWKESLVRFLRSTQLGTLVKVHAADLVNNQIYNFLSIFFFKWWHCHCHFQTLKYKVSIQFVQKIWILKFKNFAKYPSFGLAACVLTIPPSKPSEYSFRQPSFSPPPSIRLAPPVLLWFVFSLDQTSSLKKTWLRACVIGRLLVQPYYCWLWRLVMSLVRFDPCLLSQLNSRLLLVKLSVVKSITLNLLMKWPTRSYSAYLWKDLWVQTSHRRIVVGNHWFETLPGHEKKYPGNLNWYTVKSIAV